MDNNHIRLTSAEIGKLWASYMSNSLSVDMLKVFLSNTDDHEIKELLVEALKLSDKNVQSITDMYRQENHPIPHGFTDEDINLKAPRIFSDSFYLYYLKVMTKLGLSFYSIALTMTARADVQKFFTENIYATVELSNKITNILLSKGIYIRPPYIPYPEKVEFIEKQGFLDGYFGKIRPLHALGLAQLHDNIQFNSVIKALLIAFSQVTKMEQIRTYFIRGKEIDSKQNDVMRSILEKDDISVPMTWDLDVTKPTESPFSDKLMMFMITQLSAAKVRNYGDSLAESTRHDLSSLYARISVESANYFEDGANIMIEHGWLEQPPLAANRKDLVSV